MPSKQRKHILVNLRLIPRLEQKMRLTKEKFNTVGNRFLEKGLDSEEKDLTPSMVEKVLPGFETEVLLSLIGECVGIISSRKTDLGIEGQMAIAAWEKVVSGEKLDIPDYSRIAKALDISLEEVQKAIEVENTLGMEGLDAGKSGS